ncbi:tyrosyl-tRNA synthetase [Mycoplasmopsis californica]|uniref:Tyrosine--tRNA ligase n=1 Tax=Mycoplasmopsis californica TaxID=2113 RepID=A0A059XV54_9BACT|nr:tyrosine--tRNA ligase [Mycoplasmopsis californica]AIA29206.1 tyrosyl-tRNA synthetase [Mycoplasmopsis californica]
MNVLKELKDRGILKQISNEEKFNQLKPSEVAVYAGFDPTAKSLHLGNYIIMATLKRFQIAGFKTYAMVGGATGMIGDPSFRDSERILLDNSQVNENKNKIKLQLSKIGLDVIDNYEIYKDMNILTFLRDVGKLVNISYMLAKDSVSSRINRGLSFTEFAYTLLQGNDFLNLYTNDNIRVQIGGSDQWGNITTGLDMISTVFGDANAKAVGITLNLLTDENGNKIGKSTGGGALWLDKTMSSPYNMYQYLVTQGDFVTEKMLYWFTFLKIEEIAKIIEKHSQNPAKQYAQQRLAYEVVKDIFGEEDAQISKNIASILYSKDFDATQLNVSDIELMQPYLKVVQVHKNANLIEELIGNKILNSKREAREFIQTQALRVDGEAVTESYNFNPKFYQGKFAILKKGKKQTILLKTI